MPRGGARNRSGPQPDPKSERSEKLGVRFGKLPRAGYTGRLPKWPLSPATKREREVWNEAWRTPQAAAWATEPWRHRSVAMWVRYSVRMEDIDAPAAIAAATLRLADQIGLTPAGLRENRWEIEEVEGARVEPAAPAPGRPPTTPKDGRVPVRKRLTVIAGAGGA